MNLLLPPILSILFKFSILASAKMDLRFLGVPWLENNTMIQHLFEIYEAKCEHFGIKTRREIYAISKGKKSFL